MQVQVRHVSRCWVDVIPPLRTHYMPNITSEFLVTTLRADGSVASKHTGELLNEVHGPHERHPGPRHLSLPDRLAQLAVAPCRLGPRSLHSSYILFMVRVSEGMSGGHKGSTASHVTNPRTFVRNRSCKVNHLLRDYSKTGKLVADHCWAWRRRLCSLASGMQCALWQRPWNANGLCHMPATSTPSVSDLLGNFINNQQLLFSAKCRRAQTTAPKQLPDVDFEEQVDPGIEVCLLASIGQQGHVDYAVSAIKWHLMNFRLCMKRER